VRREIRSARGPRPARELVATVLLDPPEQVDSVRVHSLLCCIPRMGPARAAALLEREQLHERHTLGDLTIGRALRLAGRLRDGAKT
jgi:hypothetical protein